MDGAPHTTPRVSIADDLAGAARLASELAPRSLAFFSLGMRDVADEARFRDYACIAVRSIPGRRKVSWIEAARRLGFVERLAIVGLDVSAPAAWMIARELPRLSDVEMTSTELGDDGVTGLVDGLHAAQAVERLALENTQISGVAFLGLAGRLRGLKRLNVANNALGDNRAAQIAREFPGLTHVDLSGNQLTDFGVAQLMSDFRCLEELDLSNNLFGSRGARSIIERGDRLRRLSLRGNDIDAEALTALAKLPNLVDLDS
jgi:hypothetical protein